MDTVLLQRLSGTPTSSFFIGGGAYTLPRAWNAKTPSAQITVAEVDPEVTRLAQQEMWLPKQGIQVLHKDARVALESLDTKFQVIVGDAFTDIAVSAPSGDSGILHLGASLSCAEGYLHHERRGSCKQA